eukprot:1092833-Pelagomonas_calceolata.AAC.2
MRPHRAKVLCWASSPKNWVRATHVSPRLRGVQGSGRAATMCRAHMQQLIILVAVILAVIHSFLLSCILAAAYACNASNAAFFPRSCHRALPQHRGLCQRVGHKVKHLSEEALRRANEDPKTL